MLTPAPLPAWSHLIRALLRPSPSSADLVAPWHHQGEVAGLLSRSSWSLALIVLWRQEMVSTRPVKVWVPDFFCDSALVALRATGAKLVLYPLTAGLAPDFGECRSRAEADPPDLFVLVHYFGQSAPAAIARDFCARHGAWLIEDAAHVLRPLPGIGSYGDFVLYSPHKHLPIPDGAVLVVRSDGPGKTALCGVASVEVPSSWAGQLTDLRKHLGLARRSSHMRAAVWLAKRLLQKLGARRLRRAMAPFQEPTVPRPTDLTYLGAPTPSGLARRLLAGELSGLRNVARSRQRHQLLWDTLLLDDETACPGGLGAAERPGAWGWTPYLASYRVDPAAAEATYQRLLHHGLPVTTWPDLMPEVIADRNRHAGAWAMRHNRLYLPLHQSLSAHELARRVPRRSEAEGRGSLVRPVWDLATRTQWQQGLERVGRSNLMQSWAYGEAKATHQRWRVKRGIFYSGDEPIALVQILQRSVAGLLRIARVNRGPLLLRPLQPQEERAVWQELSRLGNLRRGRLLSLAPELSLSGPSLALLEDLGFLQFSRRAWESVWIDLGLELPVLRQRLAGKWRNMLTLAQRAEVKLEIGSDDRLFDWMMERYQELMREKGFRGPSTELLLALRRSLGDEDRLIVLRAVHEAEPVAGICLVRHGTAATYLLGWNGAQGRSLRANQYLLWQSIVHLKQLGLRWFDLGGIDEESTPGIAAFKLGLNGERYELVGEYWKW